MTVSVLIPAYNAAADLPRALDSLRAQTRKADEIIVCDDGSREDPAPALAAYPEVRLVRQTHGGLSKARNTLLDEAKGDVVMFLDADDTVRPEWIARQAGMLEETGADIAVCGILAGRQLDERRYTWPCEGKGRGVIDGAEYYRCQLEHRPGVYSYLPLVAMRREQLMRRPRVRGVLGLQAHEDEAFLLQVAKRVKKVAFTEECLYEYIYTPQSICADYMRSQVPTARTRYQWYLKDFSKFRTSRRPGFLVKSLRNLVYAWCLRLFKGEPLT